LLRDTGSKRLVEQISGNFRDTKKFIFAAHWALRCDHRQTCSMKPLASYQKESNSNILSTVNTQSLLAMDSVDFLSMFSFSKILSFLHDRRYTIQWLTLILTLVNLFPTGNQTQTFISHKL
jgi:hypothetical protein